MKKIVVLTVSIFFLFALTVKAANPIPSYYFPLNGNANFTEIRNTPSPLSLGDEKRDMNVSNGGGNYILAGSSITIIVYRMDWKKTVGPLTVPEGATVSVPIDHKEWGVLVSTSSPTIVSVWTSDN